MKVSVVIAAYNEETFLPLVLTSLQKQTFRLPYEIIVVDNNSTDKTAEVAKSFGARVVQEKKQGYAPTVNAGFRAAQGEIITRADSDYLLPPDWMQKLWDGLAKDPDCIALGGPTYPLESGFLGRLFFCPGVLIYMYFLKTVGKGYLFPNIAVRREAYYKIGGFNEHLTFGEDLDFSKRLSEIGKVKIVPSLFVYASTRRVKDLGITKYILQYSLGNLLAVSRHKKVTVGLNPVRLAPPKNPHMYNPTIYFTIWGVAIVALIGSVVWFMYR